MDHFPGSYVIEYAESEVDAMLNLFEDDDTYDDSLLEDELIPAVQTDLMKYVTE